jgi:3-methyladenine DNA glycosylase AlkC
MNCQQWVLGCEISKSVLLLLLRIFMAELFKENLSLTKVHELGQSIAERAVNYDIQFDEQGFKQQLNVFALEQGEEDWQLLTLMQRLRAAAKALHHIMPEASGADAVVAALQTDKDISGWLSLICCEYVGIHEQLSLEQGLYYLQQITEFFSAEFAIRHFILRQPEQVLVVLQSWLEHDNHHVRRLVSEGTRPRLPWGVRLPIFIEQPELVIPLLTALRDDEEEYVRRSVANHLNDIAKDHPDLVIEIAQDWLSTESLKGLSSEKKLNRTKLIRHACRTLFKQANPDALSLFGYGAVDDLQCSIELHNNVVPWGGDLVFDLAVTGKEVKNNKFMIDYIIHYKKANGKLAPKVFKWLDRREVLTQGNSFQKKQSFKAISTRKYYPGLHKIEIIMNGIKKAEAEFELSPENRLD